MTNYTFSNMTNVSTFQDWIAHVNGATGDLWGYIIVFTVWCIAFLALANGPKEEAFAAASFISFIVAALLWAAVGDGMAMAVILTVTAVIASALMLFYRK